MRVAYLDCAGGLAGDMVVASLLDVGAPQDVLHDVVRALRLHGVKVEIDRTSRSGVAGTQVRLLDAEDATPRPSSTLIDVVGSAALDEGVRRRALECLGRLIDAEALVHGSPCDELILHELSGVDTLVDVVGAFGLLDALAVERVVVSPIPYARGTIVSAHGTLPGPGPAVMELLRGFAMVGVEAVDELVTPTGAAIVASAARSSGPLPPMTVERIGYGAGSRDTMDRPNVLRTVLGTSTENERANLSDVVLLETNLDDLLPELVPDTVAACMAAGALDVWTTPVLMKKGRPGIVVAAMATPASQPAVARAMLSHSSTLGVRVRPMQRYELERSIREVSVRGITIRVKLGMHDGEVVNVAPEHEDCSDAARKLRLPTKQVWALALAEAASFWGNDAGSA